MKKTCLARLAGWWLVGWLGFCSSAYAITIDYVLVSLGANDYRYEYTVTNDGSLGPGVALELFDIVFDPALYLESSLTIVTSTPPAADWWEDIFPSIPILDEPALYDVFARNGGIADGSRTAGFAVEFEWLDSSARPGAQPFLVYDPSTFDVLEESITRLQQPGPGPIPEPGSLFLLGLGLLPLAWATRPRNYRRLSSMWMVVGRPLANK